MHRLKPFVQRADKMPPAGCVQSKGKHACDVAELSGAVFEGRKHTALADAKGVAAGYVALIKRGAPNPFLSQRS